VHAGSSFLGIDLIYRGGGNNDPATAWLAGRFGRTYLLVVSLVGFTVVSYSAASQVRSAKWYFSEYCRAYRSVADALSQAILLDTHSGRKWAEPWRFGAWGLWSPLSWGPHWGLSDRGIQLALVLLHQSTDRILTVLGTMTFIPESVKVRIESSIGLAFHFKPRYCLASTRTGSGEQLGWFASAEIEIEVALAVFGIYMFVVHSLTAQRPFIDLALFRDRNFVLCIVLAIVTNLVFNGSFVLSPQLLQTELNYPVVTAAW